MVRGGRWGGGVGLVVVPVLAARGGTVTESAGGVEELGRGKGHAGVSAEKKAAFFARMRRRNQDGMAVFRRGGNDEGY